jgi:integrase
MPRKPRWGTIYRRKKRLLDGQTKELGPWWIQYRADGKRVRESSKSARYADAENLLRRRLREIDDGTYAGPATEKVTVHELIDDVLTDYETNDRFVERALYSAGHIRPFFGNMKAVTIGTSRLNAYVKERRRAGVTNGTINRELALLRRAFNLASESQPPKVKRVPKFPKLKEAAARKGFFEHDEFLALRLELPDYLRPVITFAYYTGCRRGEILGLRWSQMDLRQRIVRLEPGETKNDEPREIPMIGELYDMISMQKQIRDQRWPGCPWVFFRDGARIKNFRKAWESALDRALSSSEKAKLFHDLRRTGIRNLVRAGVPERVAMMISGHKTRSVFDRYNIVSRRDLYEAVMRLEHHITELETDWDGHTLGTLAPDERSVSRARDSIEERKRLM